jgi:SOS-response transcriptional repressor LexA
MKTLREALGLTQKSMSEASGIGRTDIADVEAGRIEPSFNFIRSLNTTFNLDTNWLLTGKGTMFLPKEGERKDIDNLIDSGLEKLDCGLYAAGDKVYLPLSSVTACCGPGFDVFENYDIGDAVLVTRKSVGALIDGMVPFVVQTEGRSMEGFGIKDGSMVVVNPAEDVYSGCVAMVVYGEQASIKKVYDTPEGKDLIASNGMTLHVSSEALEEGWGARIVGRVMYVMSPPDEGV